jgi:hypothetical protein
MVNHTIGCIPKGNENSVWKSCLNSPFIEALFTITKIEKQSKCLLMNE